MARRRAYTASMASKPLIGFGATDNHAFCKRTSDQQSQLQAIVTPSVHHGATPLLIAAWDGHGVVVESPVKAGCDVPQNS